MNISTPLLSVIMTNYNHGLFLEERLNSILEQLKESDEVVIVDDDSTDNSVEIIQTIQKKDSRIRLVRNEQNQGVIRSVNRALLEAKGTYIASLAADDKILPGFIEKTLKVLKEHPELPLCCSDCGLSFDGFPEKDPHEIFTTKLLPNVTQIQHFCPKTVAKKIYQHHFWIPGHSSIIKREAMLKYGGFKESLTYLCDWFLIHSIALHEGAAYIPETLSVWRQHNKTYSAQLQNDEEKKRKIHLALFKELSQPENRTTRRVFRKSTLLHYYVKNLFSTLLLKPQHYDIVIPVVTKVLKNKIRRFLRQNPL